MSACPRSRKRCPRYPRAGNPYILPIRSQANAVAFKSLFMDLDAKGKSKDSYDTLEEALAAFTNFIGVVGLPKPNVIVKTGGGFHVYWTFDRALTDRGMAAAGECPRCSG